MAQISKNNSILNVFDLAALVVVIFVISLFIFSLSYTPKIQGKQMTITMKVTSDDKAIYESAKNQKEVYLNSSNQPLLVKKTNYNAGYLEISLSGIGEIRENSTTFNGERLLVGQKAEIHGNYFSQGIITSIKYED